MRIALYTRLSPNPDKKDTENQERQLREFVSRNVGWEIVRTFTDIHLSGSKKGKDRPKFTLMMLEASQKKFDMILFWALDRLTREGMLATLQYLDQLEKWGIKYKSYTEPHIDSLGPFNDIFLSIASTFAKLERSKLIERTKVGLETARLKGKRLGRQYLEKCFGSGTIENGTLHVKGDHITNNMGLMDGFSELWRAKIP